MCAQYYSQALEGTYTPQVFPENLLSLSSGTIPWLVTAQQWQQCQTQHWHGQRVLQSSDHAGWVGQAELDLKPATHAGSPRNHNRAWVPLGRLC